MTPVEQLFDQYAVRFRRGERPDLREYLTRAGEGAEELAALVDRFLQAAPAPEADEEAVDRARAWLEGESAAHRARLKLGLRRAEVVDALVRALGLDPAKREKVARYYHQLESGLLEPKRVDRRVWEALGATLKAPAGELLAWRPAPPAAQAPAAPAYYRLAEMDKRALADMAAPAAEEPDDVDRLFGAA